MRYTYQQFQAEYPTDDACLDKIMSMKFGEKSHCPGCGAETKFHRITKRRAYVCQLCGHHVYPCVGTPFEKSRTSLQKWFYAMYLFTATKHGVPAKELERQLGVTYKTAWRIAHELRKLMAQANGDGPLGGHVEIDETYVGGKVRGKGRGPSAGNKTIVLGMMQRDGDLRAGIVPNVRRNTLEPIILRHVSRTATISTDELASYRHLSAHGYKHGTVRHSLGEYVVNVHHVNSVEGFWSRLKNSIRGTHVHVSSKHLWKYVSEFSYRYNMRGKNTTPLMFSHLVACLAQPFPRVD